MEPNHSNFCSKSPVELPFEVLGFIFAYYVKTETLFHSLESLLLVSRLWKSAALGHKALWGNLNIHLGHRPTQDAWKVILPRRLHRAGSTLLSINIRYALEGLDHPHYKNTRTCNWGDGGYLQSHYCFCAAYAAGCTNDLLWILAGSKGEHCKRWKRLYITLGGSYGQHHNREHPWTKSSLLCGSLSHPMPLLEKIHLMGLELLESTSQTPFPSIPSVRVVHFERCIFDSLDGVNFSSAESITIRDIAIRKGSSTIFKFKPPTAIKFIQLEKVDLRPSRISGSFPHLHTLHFGEDVTNVFAPDYDFSLLKTLSIPVSSGSGSRRTDIISFKNLTSSFSFPLSTVKFLTLLQIPSRSRELLVGSNPFLDELASLKRITGSRRLIAYTLKYILEVNTQREGNRTWSNLSSRTLELVNSDTGSMAQLMFEETMRNADICAAGKLLDVPNPMLSWGECEYDLIYRDSYNNVSSPP